MRRLLSLLVVGLILLPVTASAAPQIRTDPDDTSSIMDIHRVTTAQHVRRTYFGISSYDEAFEPAVLYDGFWEFQLDTKRGGEFGSNDYFLDFLYNRREPIWATARV